MTYPKGATANPHLGPSRRMRKSTQATSRPLAQVKAARAAPEMRASVDPKDRTLAGHPTLLSHARRKNPPPLLWQPPAAAAQTSELPGGGVIASTQNLERHPHKTSRSPLRLRSQSTATYPTMAIPPTVGVSAKSPRDSLHRYRISSRRIWND